MLGEYGREVLVRIALMQEHGLAALNGQPQLPLECLALRLWRGIIAKIVKAAFTHRHNLRLRQ